jgi:acetylglutamate kinase
VTEAERARVLVETLPYLREWHGRTIVVKYGGAAMTDEVLKRSVMLDMALMHAVGICPILVHGGGPELTAMMKRLGKEAVFVRGLRVTDAETAGIAEMVLAGRTNKEIVGLLQRHGARACGVSGKDGGLFLAEPLRVEGADLGYVGDVVEIRTHLLETLIAGGYIPVICNIAAGRGGETYNVNADHVAGRLAAELRAAKLVLLTDVRGILEDVSDPASLRSQLTAAEARDWIDQGRVDRGMIPKVEACLMALEGGVPRTHVLDGRTPHSILTELFSDAGSGTMIVP